MNLKVEDLINKYQLEAHPEGGFYTRIYKHKEDYGSAILYLLGKEDRSHFHKIGSDEIWNFYEGGTLTLYILSPKGSLEEITLNQENRFHIVPAEHWMAAEVTRGEYASVNCVVFPAFRFEKWCLADTSLRERIPKRLWHLIFPESDNK